MDIFLQILGIVVFSIVGLMLYNVLKTYVLHRINVSKWIVLAVAMVIFLVPMIIWPQMPRYISNYVIPGIFVILFLWFMDLSGFMKKRNVATKPTPVSIGTKKDKKKDVVIKPKAKPNRVKNNK